MAKSGGGGSKNTPFNSIWNAVTVLANTKEFWVDVTTIPSGIQYQLGKLDFTPLDENCGVEIRINNPTKSSGTEADTYIVGVKSARVGTTASIDLWRRGRLETITPVGTGVEHVWLMFYSRKSITTEVIWSLTYLEL